MKVWLMLIAATMILTACGSEKEKQSTQLPYVLVLPSEIKHNYANQQLIFRGLKFDGYYNVQIDEVKARAFFSAGQTSRRRKSGKRRHTILSSAR